MLALASIYLIWGGSFAVTRIGVRELPPFLFGGLRFTVAGLLLLAIAYALGNRPRFDRVELRHLFWVALGSVVISNGANVWSMQWMASNHSALLNATAALWIAVLSCFGPRAHALDRRTAIGLLLGFAGTAMILLGSTKVAAGPGNRAWLPEVVVLFGVLGWSLATVYLRNFPSKLDIMSFTAGQMLIGGLIMLTIGLSAGELPRWQWTPAGTTAFLYMMLLSSIVAYTPYGWLAKNATPAVVGSYSYVSPAIAAVVGWWLLDEYLSGLQLIGMAAMLLGVALSSWPQSKSASGTAPNEGHGA
jgi:drug/metabolite transporter (DMT)-like permease